MTGNTLKLERFLPYRLNILAESISQGLADLYSQRYGITIAEWRVLAILGEHSTLTSAAIARHSRMHKTKVSRAIADLEKKDLVGRIANDADMREAFVALTPAGSTLYGQIVPLALGYSDELASRLTKADQEALWRIIGKLDPEKS